MEIGRIVVIVAGGGEAVSNNNMTRYVLQFPNLPEPTVMDIHDSYRDGFVDIYSSFFLGNFPPMPELLLVQDEKIPDAMLITCTPNPEDTCAICLEEAKLIEVIDVDMEDSLHTSFAPHPSEHEWVFLCRCNHRFHRHCVKKAHGNNCPLCRMSHSSSSSVSVI